MQIWVAILKDMGLVHLNFYRPIKMYNTVENCILRMLLLNNRGLVTFFLNSVAFTVNFLIILLTFGLSYYKQEARRILKLWIWL